MAQKVPFSHLRNEDRLVVRQLLRLLQGVFVKKVCTR